MFASDWERRDYSHLLDGLYEEAEDEENDTPEHASDMFFDMLVGLKMCGKLSAKSACILSHWASKAGMTGRSATIGLPPDRTGGVYSSHFDKITGLDDLMHQQWYRVPIPVHCKYDGSRTIKEFACQPVHVSLAEEIADSKDFFQSLRKAVSENSFSTAYTSDELVRSSPPGTIVPIGIYLDGVKYQNRDSTLGIWAINLATNRRHLMLCLPKRSLCRCGCRGWCSLDPALRFVEWTFTAMRIGKYPASFFDGPWRTQVGADVAGEDLGFLAVCCILKADWAEFSGTLGFRSWAHHEHACFRCWATGGPAGTWQQTSGIDVLTIPWAERSWQDLVLACDRAEVIATINNAADQMYLVDRLQYDKRPRGNAGRCVKEQIDRFSLEIGDRLEPSIELLNVGDLEACTRFPLRLTFWRLRRQTCCTHRCPLFSIRSGILPSIICVDELHTLHLGVFLDFSGAAVWQLFDADVWGLKGLLPADHAYHLVACSRLKSELFSWYKRARREHPKRPLYEFQDLMLSMLGTRDKPSITAKAGESGTFVYFVQHLVTVHKRSLPRGEALHAAGECLLKYLSVTRGCGLRMPVTARQAVADALVKFVGLREAAGIPFKPKAHLTVHMISDCARFGNPRLTGTWVDEGLNAALAATCRAAHAAVWSERVMACFGHSAGPTARAQSASKKPRTH